MQLEFSQAMSDFKVMFPEMDRDVIEAVLRANHGAVDATIDQLLAMSIDNQNESLRNEMEKTTPTRKPAEESSRQDPADFVIPSLARRKPSNPQRSLLDEDNVQEKEPDGAAAPDSTRRWNPPMLLPLPTEFLRMTYDEAIRVDFDLPDEHFAKMLQNKEFMKQLRWNQEFMNALGTEQEIKGRHEDDAAFKERLKHMGQVSRRKFLQLARVFAWQKNKKPSILRSHSEAQPLKEEPSDEEGEVETRK